MTSQSSSIPQPSTTPTNEELVAIYRQCEAILGDIETFTGTAGGVFVSIPVSPRWLANPFISKKMLREEVTGAMNGAVRVLLDRGVTIDGVSFVNA